MATREQLNHWGTLTYHDPARILRELRALEHEVASIEDDRVRRLRTPTLKKYREWRDAALFTYGMRLVSSDRIFDRMKETFDAVARRAFELRSAPAQRGD